MDLLLYLAQMSGYTESALVYPKKSLPNYVGYIGPISAILKDFKEIFQYTILKK